MATEQAWGDYALQAYVDAGDTFLLGTATDTIGARCLGTNIVARRSSGGPYRAQGDMLVDSGVVVGTSGAGFGRMVTASSALYIQSGNTNASGGTANSIVFGNMYGGAGAAVHPTGDNSQPLGLGSFRWSVVYAGTGTINTSDEREKDWRGGLNAAELRAAKRIAGELGFYRWLDAIAEKGDAARLHFGARAQQVWSIMADEGLVDPIVDGIPGDTPYAFLCFDEWDATADQLDDEGNVAMPARKAGNRFGLRVDQLALFLIAAQEQRLAALEPML